MFNSEHAHLSEEDFYQLMRQSSVMVGLHHENLSPVIATCLDSQLLRPLKLVYVASSDDDNLRLFLQRCRHSQVLKTKVLLSCHVITVDHRDVVVCFVSF